MKQKIRPEGLCGVWSAAPTPLRDDMTLDKVAVRRMVDHHVRLGVRGLFLAGTNGEGPWMPDACKRELVREVVRWVAGRMPVAVQVSDNSAARIMDNVRAAREDGADIAVIAPPAMLLNATPRRIRNHYLDAVRACPLPVGIYDRGRHSSVFVPESVLRAVYREPNVVLVKDSSSDPQRRDLALAARRRRPELRLLDGDEFHCVDYLAAGYDGLLLGGGVFNGFLAGMIMEAVAAGDLDRARRLQRRMNRMMWSVYGGRKIRCWLSGEKALLVELGVFRTWKNYLEYPLTASCRRAIARVLERDRDVLLPPEVKGRG
jgi:4-hydroxy-tetrahydrodipicolinate synthase